ncbi:MAG: nitronate monooxygenase [Deltaproteobacteria bacterium]|nr:nitronate monooxygenase [Deltaproteobacteria bacterium]
METWLTRTLGIRHPVVQGAYHGFGTSKIAGPVSAAGGLGVVTAHCFPGPEELRADLRAAHAVARAPVGVNFTVIPGKGLTCDGYVSRLEAALDEGVKVVFTSAHDGAPLGERVKRAGGLWIHKCATLRHALSTARKGADAIVIVGVEGTGFKNPEQNTTLVNITALRRRTDTPLIAAGGIGDGRGLAAALAMGACGVYLGTAFMATLECPIPQKWKQAIVDQDVTDPEYHRRVLAPSGRDRRVHSMASGVIDRVRAAEELLRSLVEDAEEAIRGIRL